MHLLIVMAFGLLIWQTDQQAFRPPIDHPALAIAIAGLQVVLWWIVARACSAYALRRIGPNADGLDAAQFTYHRATMILRFLIFAGFAASVLLTRWPQLVGNAVPTPRWSGIADLVVISPFLISLVALWHATFPIERTLREHVAANRAWEGAGPARTWNLREYLSFSVRHHILIVAVPMTIILVTYRFCEHHRSALVDALLFPWVPDAILGLVAASVFILSPLLLKSIWVTSSLPDGPLRQRLEQACARTQLRCRDILVWNSCGMMINAAVMGIFAPVRYVLLSDGLIEGLDQREIEAVFGHEAGHVRQHHMQYFLLFAVASVLCVSGVMELVIRLAEAATPPLRLSDTLIQGIGLGLIALLWGVVFGWLSRRFERHADVCGAHCASPPAANCAAACSVHPSDGNRAAPGHPVCATGAQTFVDALDRVASLNGIPHEEWSWRHSSIASRMRFLMAQAGDPATAAAFHRLIRNLQRTLWIAAAGGLVATAAYCLWHPHYREVILRSTVEPLSKLGRTATDTPIGSAPTTRATMVCLSRTRGSPAASGAWTPPIPRDCCTPTPHRAFICTTKTVPLRL